MCSAIPNSKIVIPAKRAEREREPGPIVQTAQWVPDNALTRVSGMTSNVAQRAHHPNLGVYAP